MVYLVNNQQPVLKAASKDTGPCYNEGSCAKNKFSQKSISILIQKLDPFSHNTRYRKVDPVNTVYINLII